MSELTQLADSRQPTVPERWFRHLLGFTAALVMFCMMLLTFVDVGGRYLFSMPVPGGFEITELLLAALIFLGLPLVTAEGGHVDVDLLDAVLPGWFNRVQYWFVSLLNIAAFAVLTWLLWKFALRTWEYQDTTAILHIPYYFLTLLMAVCSTLATIALLLMLPGKHKRLFPPDEEFTT